MVVNGEVIEQRTCMACGEKEGQGVVVYPVWSWYGRFMGRWCDWCRELLCWDCGERTTECRGECSGFIFFETRERDAVLAAVS